MTKIFNLDIDIKRKFIFFEEYNYLVEMSRCILYAAYVVYTT